MMCPSSNHDREAESSQSFVDLKYHEDGCNPDWYNLLKDSDTEWAVATLYSPLPYEITHFNATARNRFRQSTKRGYTSRPVSWSERNTLLSDIHEINISATIRQGREMGQSYKDYPKAFTIKEEKCPYHRDFFIGCFFGDKLVGYITMNKRGNMAAASQILGHADHLKNSIMFSLWHAFVTYCIYHNIQTIVYSKWSDGTDGLRVFKRALGLRPSKITLV